MLRKLQAIVKSDGFHDTAQIAHDFDNAVCDYSCIFRIYFFNNLETAFTFG